MKLLLCLLFVAWADDTGFGSIKKIDLGEDRPQGPSHVVVTMNLGKVKPGRLGQVIVYQFSRKVRVDFEGDLPKGDYSLRVASSCAGANGWSELHRFTSNSTHIQTEKSLLKASLNEAKPGFLKLMGKSLALYRGAQQIDCKTIVPSEL